MSDMTHREPFWMVESRAEILFARSLMQRRFPAAYSLLTESLEKTDPLAVVDPDNPDEYGDAVREMLVIADRVDGDLGRLSLQEIEELVREGLGRCFGEEPDDDRVQIAVRLIHAG